MHRSGTSIVALALRRLGVDLVDDVESGDAHNPAGYGEDRDFVEFHRALFDRQWADPGDPSLGHHHDWGYDPAETFDPTTFDAVGDDAARLLDRETGCPWGFKDPRATLVLDAWVRRVRDARVVLVVRQPDAVAASMASLGEGPWRDPVLAHRIWRFYNRRVLDFARRSTVPCVVVDGSLATAAPAAFADVMHRHLALSLDPAGVVFDHLAADRYAVDVDRHRLPLRERVESDILWHRLRRRVARPGPERPAATKERQERT